ncbi:DUF5822 domain-containing protein [Halospeciosus flavus]|uniref:DUF5822 domain-containing protein n=1 Tax=Halospeciosus flavus TaxID=3032283 RepID=A0ABD5Z1J3_9EURY
MPERDTAETADVAESADVATSIDDANDANDADEDVDYEWVMQTTFVLTIAVGAPLVALTSLFVDLAGWRSWVSFAVRVGALVWFLTAVAVAVYARRVGR